MSPKYPAGKGLPFIVLLIWGNAPGHLEPHEFNPEGDKVVYLAANTMPLIQPLDQGVIRTFKAHYTRYSMESITDAMEENPDRTSREYRWITPVKTPLLLKKKP